MIAFGSRMSWQRAWYEAVIPPPLGLVCARCDEPIGPNDDGVIMPHVGVDGVAMMAWHRADLELEALEGDNAGERRRDM